MSFRTGAQHAATAAKRPGSRVFEQALLPDAEKERLCRDLLAEFGVTQIKVTTDGEMIHSCPLPFGEHKNGDATPSASLNYTRLTFNCLGCGCSGGLLWFIATCRGESTTSAREWLDDQTGFGADEQSLASLLQFFDAVYGPKMGNRTAPIPKMNAKVLTPWLAIHPYMTEDRGISEQILMRFQVGYAPAYRVKVGEVSIESPRIVIPHFWKGTLVGWQTRRLISDGTAKYLSSPDFPKDATIYHYDPKIREAVVVESPMSVLATADDGVHYEATFGAKVTDRQCALLSQHPRLVLWFDNDQAGWKATTRLADYAVDYSDVWVVENDWQQDVGDLTEPERQRLLSESLVPYAIWGPPTQLRCFACKQEGHKGPCERVQEGGDDE